MKIPTFYCIFYLISRAFQSIVIILFLIKYFLRYKLTKFTF